MKKENQKTNCKGKKEEKFKAPDGVEMKDEQLSQVSGRDDPISERNSL